MFPTLLPRKLIIIKLSIYFKDAIRVKLFNWFILFIIRYNDLKENLILLNVFYLFCNKGFSSLELIVKMLFTKTKYDEDCFVYAFTQAHHYE